MREPCYNVPLQRVMIEVCFTCLNSFSSSIIYYETTNVELMHFLMQNGSHRIKVSYKIEQEFTCVFWDLRPFAIIAIIKKFINFITH